ncbi:MAG TPA: HD domain-containing protein [Polyangiales bacterium]|nr:HD domain-containing protein [Polyangiales bacterium]
MTHELPDTRLIQEAARLAQTNLPPPIYLHSQRTFLLGREYARAAKIAFEEEDLLLAALFHDLGLSDAFADSRRAFPEIGGTLAREFMTERGQAVRGRVLAEAIDLHMQLFPRWSKGPITGLLQVGAWMDAAKRRANTLDGRRIAEIEAAYPRNGFKPEFQSRFRRALGSWRACARLVFPTARL